MSLDQKQSSGLKRSYLKRSQKPIAQSSPRSIKYEDFRNLKAVKDRDQNGLLHCQDYLLGLPRCGAAAPSMDLHHTEGRNGDLLFDESKMVWLIRSCHEAAHNTSSSRTKAQDDTAGSLVQRPESRRSEKTPTPQRDAILGLQSRPAQSNSGKLGRTVYSSVQNSHAPFVARKKESIL